MPTFEEVKARASRPATAVALCLDGAALGEIRDLERRLAEAPLPGNLGERSQAAILREQIEQVQERARESEVDFKLRAIRGADWLPFWQTRPAREPDESEEAFNARWFVFVCDMLARTCVDPVMTPEQVAELADELPLDSWDRLCGAAWDLNTRKVTIPFSDAVSVLTQTSDETSRRQPSSASPSPASEASPSEKPSSTTTPTAG